MLFPTAAILINYAQLYFTSDGDLKIAYSMTLEL